MRAAVPTTPGLRPLAGVRDAVLRAPLFWRAALAPAAGALSAAAFPPLHQVYVFVPALAVLLWLVDGAASRRAAFGWGWLFGFGHFAAGLYWVYYAFLVEAGTYGFLAPFAVVGLAALLAFFTGAVAVAAAGGRRTGIARVVRLAAAWTLVEWLRSWVLTGFPWNMLGTAWTFSEPMMQPAAWIGAYGLSFATFCLAALPATLADPDVTLRRSGVVLGSCAILLGSWYGAGAARLASAADDTVPGVRLRLVQPAIPQKLKWQSDLRLAHLRRQVAMSLEPLGDGPPPTHVIWAETAVPYVVDLERTADLFAFIAQAAPPGGQVIFGAPRAQRGDEFLRNALLAVDEHGTVGAYYDKTHLVPFGEYVPFRSVLRFSKLVQTRGDFVSGDGLKTLRVAGLPPFSPLICYEVIFPGAVVGAGERPRLLLNITNDAWFGLSAGPYQHFASARMRAVEEGLPLVRVANNGISGVVDAYGRVRTAIGLDRQAVVDSSLPVAVEGGALIGNFGNAPVLVVLAVAFFVLLFAFKENFPHRR